MLRLIKLRDGWLAGSGTDWPGNQQASTLALVPALERSFAPRPRHAAAAATAPTTALVRLSLAVFIHTSRRRRPLVVNHARFKLKHPPATSPGGARPSWESTAVRRSALLRPSTRPRATRPGQHGRAGGWTEPAVQCSSRPSGGSWSVCPL